VSIHRYEKLVRDHIPAIIAQSGLTPLTRTLGSAEFTTALRAKLVEEATEASTTVAPDAMVLELADLLEVIYALGNELGLAPSHLERVRGERAEERGAFAHRTYLIATSRTVI
jgi:predicted house-cleaning noncanonical NTP pyrophosphatase (MazG superfamily)